jgi:hypothetical protein
MTATTRYTIDASVFLNGFNPAEVGAVAIRFDTILVTLDREQRTRASAAIVTMSPADAVSPNG